MKILKYLFICFSLINAQVIGTEDFRLTYPDFESSMIRCGRSIHFYNQLYASVDRESFPLYYARKEAFKSLYEHDKETSSNFNIDHKIPRIIHQIWLGSPVPEKYKTWLESWQNIKGWEYRLWTDKEVEQLSLINSDLYHSASNYGEKADILRYELLYLFGGLYVDTDMYCTKPDFFEFAHQQYSFYAGIEPIEYCDFSVGNSIIASTQGHPLMEKIVMELKDHVSNGRHSSIIDKTGPRYFTSQAYNHISLLGNDGLVFPPTFFYPITMVERHEWPLLLKPENASVHFYESSWR